MIRIRLEIVSSILAIVLAHSTVAATVNLSLNVQYTDPANLALGGAWTLVAKTDSAHGISSIQAILANINATGITAQAGIGAVLNGGSPFVNNNTTSIEVLYFQDLSSPGSVVTNVGRGAGTPGNLALDPFNDPHWNNSARIFSGTFGASTPAFTTNADAPPDATEANTLSTGVPPYTFAAPALVTTIVRDNVSGDVWDNSSGSGLWSDSVNWADNTEPGAAQSATFPAGFPNGDTAITLAAGESARRLTFHDDYTLAGGALTLSGADSVLHVDAAKTATISSALTANGNLLLSGGGNAVVSHVRAAGGVHLLSGSLKVAPNGGDAGTSRVSSLQIDAGNQLDLSDNDLIIDGGDFAQTTAYIASGQMKTSAGVAHAALGMVKNDLGGGVPRFTTFGGLSVDINDLLVKFTYIGDANLDGRVSIADYLMIDRGRARGQTGWAAGDFNYSGGPADGMDYMLMDQAFLNQGAPLIRSVGMTAPVPEPSAVGVLVAAGLLSRRTRRKDHSRQAR